MSFAGLVLEITALFLIFTMIVIGINGIEIWLFAIIAIMFYFIALWHFKK